LPDLCKIYVDSVNVGVRGIRNFFMFEVDSESFVRALGKAKKSLETGEWEKWSREVRDYFEKNIMMENRRKEWEKIISF